MRDSNAIVPLGIYGILSGTGLLISMESNNLQIYIFC